MLATAREPALRAGRILSALESGNLARLESELEPSGRLCASRPELPPDQSERLELLEAIASEMRTTVDRMRRRLTDRLEAAEVHIRLLRHLAADL